jgi:hypothetical protein
MGELEKIKFSIQTATKTALDVIERGMTKSEVERVAGPPRAEAWPGYWNYGNVWVIFEGGIVGCIIDIPSYSKCRWCECDYYYRAAGILK